MNARPPRRFGVVVEQLLAPIPGGTGRYARELTAALVSTAPADWSVATWCAWHHAPERAVIGGLVPRRLPVGRRALARAWSRGWGPSPRGADVVLAPTLLLPPRRGRPLLATIHDVVPWTHPETLTPHGVAFHRTMAARAAREADAILVPTRAVAEALAEVLEVSVPVHVVGGGVSSFVVQVPPDAEARRRRLGLPPAYALTVATLEPRKGLDTLLAALSRAPSLSLAVVGPAGWGGLDAGASARAAGLDDRVQVLGVVKDADLAAVFAGACLLVSPSRAEGFGLPVLEAMAAGLPVVCSDLPAHREVAGEAAVFFRAGDAEGLARVMTEVAADGALRARLTSEGLRRAAHYTWESSARTVWEIATSLAESVTGGRP